METTTHFGGDAEEVRVEGEEKGWELVVETNSGQYRFNVHGMASDGSLEDQCLKVEGEIRGWREEGRQAALEHSIDLAKRETDEAHDRLVGDA